MFSSLNEACNGLRRSTTPIMYTKFNSHNPLLISSLPCYSILPIPSFPLSYTPSLYDAKCSEGGPEPVHNEIPLFVRVPGKFRVSLLSKALGSIYAMLQVVFQNFNNIILTVIIVILEVNNFYFYRNTKANYKQYLRSSAVRTSLEGALMSSSARESTGISLLAR